MGLLNTQRREDTVVDCVVQEQDFRWFYEDRSQWQHVMNNHEVNARRQYFGQDFNRRADTHECQNRQNHTDDASGEVVHQHFKARFDFAVYPRVEMFNRPATQRASNHRAEEHRHIRTDDNTHGGDCTHHTTTVATD